MNVITNIDDVRARIMALEFAAMFDERAWQMALADLAERPSALADAQRRMETAKRNSNTVDELIEKVFLGKKEFSNWDVALVLHKSTQVRMDVCVELARKVIRKSRRDGLIEILARRSHYYRVARGVSIETAGVA